MTNPQPTISGYTYVRKPEEMEYPVRESIESHLEFCDEVVVVNASPEDEVTCALLRDLQTAHGEDRVKVGEVDVDWEAPNHGLYDGQCKGIAREMCSGQWLVQFDIDEVLDPQDAKKVQGTVEDLRKMERANPGVGPVSLALPVMEYWGSEGKIRVDVNPWKWRLTKNHPDITHGVPLTHRVMSEEGLLFARPGTDGCDLISRETGLPIPTISFMTNEVEQVRIAALTSEQAAVQYEAWFNMVTQNLPTWHHFSWWSVERKVAQYQKFWSEFWKSMYGPSEVPDTNPFFPGRNLQDVSPEEVHALAVNLEVNTGGWIFHSPWDQKRNCHVYLDKSVPNSMKEWCAAHRTKTR